MEKEVIKQYELEDSLTRTTMTENLPEHDPGCPAATLSPHKLKQDPCSCEAHFEWENTKLKAHFPQIYRLAKKVRFMSLKIH